MSDNNGEKIIVALMIEIFCKGNHGSENVLCNDCNSLLEYAKQKLSECPFENKPKCSDCKIHCYDIEERKKIRTVMRYSGKRMVIKYPIRTIAHFIRDIK